MDNKHDILELLRQVADGKVSPESAMLELKEAPFEDLAYAKIDFHRSVRQGAAEVIYGEGKTPEQIKGIVERMGEKGCRNILVTRISQETGDYLSRFLPIDYHKIPRLGIAFPEDRPGRGNIVVATGGTSDMPVAEEAALTAEAMGNHVTRVYDVGVAGLHRLLSNLDILMQARGRHGRSPGFRGGRTGGLPGDRSTHKRRLRRQLWRTVGASVHAELLRFRVQRGEYRQWIRGRVSGQSDQSDGRDQGGITDADIIYRM